VLALVWHEWSGTRGDPAAVLVKNRLANTHLLWSGINVLDAAAAAIGLAFDKGLRSKATSRPVTGAQLTPACSAGWCRAALLAARIQQKNSMKSPSERPHAQPCGAAALQHGDQRKHMQDKLLKGIPAMPQPLAAV